MIEEITDLMTQYYSTNDVEFAYMAADYLARQNLWKSTEVLAQDVLNSAGSGTVGYVLFMTAEKMKRDLERDELVPYHGPLMKVE